MNRRNRHSRILETWFPALLVTVALGCRSSGRSDADAVAQPASRPLTLQHATLINPGARPIPDATVLVRDGRIICAGTATACPRLPGSKAIDLTGGYLGPGLVDAHVHYSQTGWVDGRPDALDLRAQYPYDSVRHALETHPERFHRADLCSGVTSVFDVGGFEWTFDLARNTRGATDAPRVVATGPLLATIRIDPDQQDQMVFMSDEATTRAAVRSHRAQGAEAIKVWYIEVPDSLRAHAKAMLLAAADETRKAGLRLVVHATELHSAKDAVEAGAAVLVHEVFSDTVDADLIAAIKQKGTIVIPTLTVLDGYADVFVGRSPARRYPLDCVDPATRHKLETILPDTLRAKGAAFWSGPGAALRTTAAGNLKRMYSAGIPIAMGTDAGNPGTAHGPAVYAEMEAMQQAGMSPTDVFAASTIGAARAMALDKEIGSIERGKRADLVVFDADPTSDIRNARQIRSVIHNGVMYSRQDLLPRPAPSTSSAPRPRAPVRLPGNPIVTTASSPTLGENLNGPSLLRVPEWVQEPLGRYYLYFAHHAGTFIRLAYADRLSGPWKVHEPGTLRLEQAPSCYDHVASPDVRVDTVRREILMYFHCPAGSEGKLDIGEQKTFLAVSRDGLRFAADTVPLGPAYFRVFRRGEYYYTVVRGGVLLRSRDGRSPFEPGPTLIAPDSGRLLRHAAVDLGDDVLRIYYSRIGDRPERILLSQVRLSEDWSRWSASAPVTVLSPEREYEGADRPLDDSRPDEAPGRVRQLRDPAIFREGSTTYLLYSVAGESGLAIAELRE